MAKILSRHRGWGSIGSDDSAFAFALPTVVEGLDSRGREFTEDTVLLQINHQGSSFHLKNPVAVGTRLRLVVDLPEKLSENKALKLMIKGRVVRIESLREGGTGQKITIKFDSKYVIKPEA
jgi:hypothetical protein